LIVGQGQATLGVDTLQHVTEAGDGCIGRGIADLGEGYKQRRALDQSSYDGLAATALDQVALPVSRNDALLDLGRSHVDRDHVGNFPASILTPCPWKSAATSLPQATEQLRAQFALRHRVQRRIDSLVARVPLRFTGVHPAQYAADLLRGMASAQQSDHLFPQPVAGLQAPRYPRRLGQQGRPLLSQHRTVATSQQRSTSATTFGRSDPSVTRQLPADRTGRALHAAGNCPQRAASFQG
jgi:hypothetical protein